VQSREVPREDVGNIAISGSVVAWERFVACERKGAADSGLTTAAPKSDYEIQHAPTQSCAAPTDNSQKMLRFMRRFAVDRACRICRRTRTLAVLFLPT
jgi:hypothetical protein